jgi:hypothetical protein
MEEIATPGAPPIAGNSAPRNKTSSPIAGSTATCATSSGPSNTFKTCAFDRSVDAANSSHTCNSAILPRVTAPAAAHAATIISLASPLASGSAAFQSPCNAETGTAPLSARATSPIPKSDADVVAHEVSTPSRVTVGIVVVFASSLTAEEEQPPSSSCSSASCSSSRVRRRLFLLAKHRTSCLLVLDRSTTTTTRTVARVGFTPHGIVVVVVVVVVIVEKCRLRSRC